MSALSSEAQGAEPATPRVPSNKGVPAPASSLDAINNLANLHRSRLNFVSAKVKIELQIKAIQRGAHVRAGTCDKKTHAKCPGVYKIETPDVALLRELALAPLETQAEARMKAMLAELPGAVPERVLAYVDETRGFARPSLAQVIAEAGDLSQYANPAKLWSRMGLGLAPDGNTRYEGRSPRRRACMAVIGANFVRVDGPYRLLYDSRKAFEQTKPSCGKTLKNAKGEVIGSCKAEEAECCKPGHIHNRTLRWVEKRLLLNLWRVWRGLEPKHKIGEEESHTYSDAQSATASSSPDQSRGGSSARVSAPSSDELPAPAPEAVP